MTPTRPWPTLATLAVVALAAAHAPCAQPGSQPHEAGWPQFHGPRRDNHSPDKGLLKRWPESGPTLIWQATGIGRGHATVAIADGTIYTAGNIGRDTMITALDMAGTTLWQATNGPAYRRSPPGARSTPTLAAGKLYHLNGDGDVACLDARTGKPIWTLNLLEQFGGRNIQWGLSESLLVVGDHVVCCPGGDDVSIVALHKDTGQTAWTCDGLGDKPSYTSPLLVDHEGVRQIVTLMATSAVGLAADTGKLLWRYEHKVASDANIVTPIYHKGHLLLFGTWGRGATMLKLTADRGRCTAEEVWRTTELDNEHGGVVLVDGYVYGQADGNHKSRHWACVEMTTGRTMYSVKGIQGRSGSLTYADGMLYLLGDRGTVALVPPSPDGFEIVSQFRLPRQGRGPTWAHPVVFGGRLYIRHGQYLYAYDVRKPPEPAPAP